ncbi:MAG: hypothetical protein KKE64_05545 [Candidatus Omnitrophica bacterium]|nr:hypothetical protein [Candidatus Omnitrophota bacterium]
MAQQQVSSAFLGAILVAKKLITKEDLMRALSEQFGIPAADLKTSYIDMELGLKFPSSLLLNHQCFPLFEEGNSVTFAIVNPLDAVSISKIEEAATPAQVKFVLIDADDIKEVLKKFRMFHISQNVKRLLNKDKEKNEQAG